MINRMSRSLLMIVLIFSVFARVTSEYHDEIPRCAEVRVKCLAGHHCEDTPTGFTCAPDPKCKTNEEFQLCSSHCEPTCDSKNLGCDDSCGPPICQCKAGFVRYSGQCVDQNQCQKLNPKGIIRNRTLTGENPCITVKCKPNFYCEVIEGAGQCVPFPGPCASVRCGFNTSCFEFDGGAGCYSTNCDTNEEFRSCSSHCEPSCGKEDIACDLSCGPPQCQCKTGYIRNNGKCVSPSDCKKSLYYPRPTTINYVDELVTPVPFNCSTGLILCDKDHHCEDVNGKPDCVRDQGSRKSGRNRSRHP